MTRLKGGFAVWATKVSFESIAKQSHDVGGLGRSTGLRALAEQEILGELRPGRSG